jgi:hypothetical protein
VGNLVWNDTNGNGLQDPGEEGIVNVIVELRTCAGAYITSTRTNWDGTYLFNNIPAGSYYMRFTLPPNYIFTTPKQGNSDSGDSDPSSESGVTSCFTLNHGTYNTNIDAGMLFNGPKPVLKIKSEEISANRPEPMNSISTSSYPNPFTTTATITFTSGNNYDHASIEVYSMDGRKVAGSVLTAIESNTTYQIPFEAANLPAGTYLYKVECGGMVASGRMFLIK